MTAAVKTPAPAWKLVVAADAPWTGEIYRTRPGGQRVQFCSAESFMRALLTVTGWSLQAPRPSEASAAFRRQAKCRSPRGESLTKRKFIVAADEPWTGDVYRTQPGLGHFHFETFEGFLGAMVDLTEWPLDVTAGPASASPA